ncbi:MAG TPA: hypothetical protein VL522_10710, partial [Bordetella sp.]|nr:hypothetical protein [Bordetella sp.]
MKDTPQSSSSQDRNTSDPPTRHERHPTAPSPGDTRSDSGQPDAARFGAALAGASSGMPLWVLALSATLGMQTVASFLDLSLPVIAPLLTAGAGLSPERVG